MMRILKFFTLIAGLFLWSAPAFAAGWGDLVEGECRTLEGTREYSAKIWTLPLVDKSALAECKRTAKDVRGVSRPPNRCDNLGLGVVYGVWYVRDSACGVAPLPSRIRTDEIDGIGRPLINPDAPRISLKNVIWALNDVVSGWARPNVQPRREAMMESMAIAWNEVSQMADVITLTGHAVRLQAAVLSDDPSAIAAREAYFARNTRQFTVELLKLPEFNEMTEAIEDSAFINTFSITLIELDGSFILGGNADINMNFGWMEERQTIGAMTGFGLGLSAGASKGVDVAMMNIGLWRDTLDDLQGNTHGITFAGPVNGIGYTLSAHFAYPDNCKFLYKDAEDFISKFKGFTVGMQTPTSVEVEYMRAHLAAWPYAIVIDPTAPDFGTGQYLHDRPATSIQPCWF